MPFYGVHSGRLRNRIVIQTATQSRDQIGGFEKSWADTKSVWADVVPVSAKEYMQADQQKGQITHRIYIRHYNGLSTSHRIKWNDRGTDRYFHIKGVIDMQSRERKMEVMAEEVEGDNG